MYCLFLQRKFLAKSRSRKVFRYNFLCVSASLREKQNLYMLQNPKRYTITAALPYTNGPIHIGHLAGVYVPSDIYARYWRLQGKDVAFLCGSDEHGVAISMKAKKEGITPQEVIDKYDGIIRKSFVDFGISFDNYSRTSSKIHHDTASGFFKKLYSFFLPKHFIIHFELA